MTSNAAKFKIGDNVKTPLNKRLYVVVEAEKRVLGPSNEVWVYQLVSEGVGGNVHTTALAEPALAHWGSYDG